MTNSAMVVVGCPREFLRKGIMLLYAVVDVDVAVEAAEKVESTGDDETGDEATEEGATGIFWRRKSFFG